MTKHKITRQDWEDFPAKAVVHADPEQDRYFLNYLVYSRQSGKAVDKALELLGGEMDRWFLEDPDYWAAYGKVMDEEDIEYLRAKALSGNDRDARFAFCRLTGYHYPAPENDSFSHRTYDCGCIDGMTQEQIRKFCHEMISMNAAFAEEAESILKKGY